MFSYICVGTDDRIYAITEIIRRDPSALCQNKITELTGIDRFFISKIRNIVLMEEQLRSCYLDYGTLKAAKKMGFSDYYIAQLWKMKETELYAIRRKAGIVPVYKMIDSCAAEFSSYIPYFYATYEDENESIVSQNKKIIVLGSGPFRIGQGVEFDYSTVHAVQTLRDAGYEAIIINNNPVTVSTDYTCSDKLYFEPLCVEDVMNIIELEHPDGVIVTLGGQTAINLAEQLHQRGVKIIGTGCDAIRRAENREDFEKLLSAEHIPQP